MLAHLSCFLAAAAQDAGPADAGPLLSVESLISLLTLTVLEIVLGIDNIVFIAILVGKLTPTNSPRPAGSASAWR